MDPARAADDTGRGMSAQASSRFRCTRCDRPCGIGGDTIVLFHPDGHAGACCSAECAGALRSEHPQLQPILAKGAHASHAMGALWEALGALQRGRSHAIHSTGAPIANLLLGVANVPVKLDTYGAAGPALVLDAALDAKAPLEQAVLHLCALHALGLAVQQHASEVAGCDVDTIDVESENDLDVAARLDAMAARVRRAGRKLHDLGFVPAAGRADAPPLPPRAPRSTLAKHWDAMAVVSVLGGLAAMGLLFLGGATLERTRWHDAPIVVSCGGWIDAIPARTWLRAEGCRADLDAAMQEVTTRGNRVESRGSIYVPVALPSAPVGSPWAYAMYRDEEELAALDAQTAFDGVIAEWRMAGRPVILAGQAPAEGLLAAAVMLGGGFIAALLALALAFGAVRGRRERREAEARDAELAAAVRRERPGAASAERAD